MRPLAEANKPIAVKEDESFGNKLIGNIHLIFPEAVVVEIDIDDALVDIFPYLQFLFRFLTVVYFYFVFFLFCQEFFDFIILSRAVRATNGGTAISSPFSRPLIICHRCEYWIESTLTSMSS